MITWLHVIDIGHTAVMIPAAAAIAAWLAMHRATSLLLWWCGLFAAGLGLVAWSKIVFLGWGLDLAAIRFQALSGHTWRATVVVPVLMFLLLQRASPRWRRAGVACGVGFGAGLAVLLVVFGLHSVSEVVASFVLGVAAATIFMARAPALLSREVHRGAIPVAVMVFVLVGALQPASLNRRLVDVALFLSGRDFPYLWSSARYRDAPSTAPPRLITECRARMAPPERTE